MSNPDFVAKGVECTVHGCKFKGDVQYFEGVTDQYGALIEDDAINYVNVSTLDSDDPKATETFDRFFVANYDEFYDVLYEIVVRPYYVEQSF